MASPGFTSSPLAKKPVAPWQPARGVENLDHQYRSQSVLRVPEKTQEAALDPQNTGDAIKTFWRSRHFIYAYTWRFNLQTIGKILAGVSANWEKKGHTSIWGTSSRGGFSWFQHASTVLTRGPKHSNTVSNSDQYDQLTSGFVDQKWGFKKAGTKFKYL